MQDDLIRLVYVSRSTADIHHLKSYLSGILDTARRNNLHHQIVGVLFYGNGYFLQCIEGQKKKIEALYTALLSDHRHQDVTLVEKHPIDRCQFSQWQMKYVRLDENVQTVLKQHHYQNFTPYEMPLNVIHALIDKLYHTHDQNEHHPYTMSSINPQRMTLKDNLSIQVSKITLAIFTVIIFIIILYVYYLSKK